MKVSEVLEQVKTLKPNTFEDDGLLVFLNELEATMQLEVLKRPTEEIIKYKLPEDSDTELLIPIPYDSCYISYLTAKVDYFNQEFASYNNIIDTFNDQYDNFKKDYQRKNNPIDKIKIKNIN